MSGARKKRPAATRPAESAVYAGSRLIGTIIERGRVLTARTAEGRVLGNFTTARHAMASISIAARAAVKPTQTNNPAANQTRAARRKQEVRRATRRVRSDANKQTIEQPDARPLMQTIKPSSNQTRAPRQALRSPS